MARRTGLFTLVAEQIRAGVIASAEDVERHFGVERKSAKNAFYAARRYYLGFRRGPDGWTPAKAPEATHGPSFGRGRGERRDDCARYEECLAAAARTPSLASVSVRCPKTCSASAPRAVESELLHLAASRPGEGAVP
jgi:hypothetical protein